MMGMTKSIARAYAAQGILAFAICLGFTMTGMADDYWRAVWAINCWRIFRWAASPCQMKLLNWLPFAPYLRHLP